MFMPEGESKSYRNMMQPSMMSKQIQMSPPPKSKRSAGIGAKVANKTVYHPGKQHQGSPVPGQPGG